VLYREGPYLRVRLENGQLRHLHEATAWLIWECVRQLEVTPDPAIPTAGRILGEPDANLILTPPEVTQHTDSSQNAREPDLPSAFSPVTVENSAVSSVSSPRSEVATSVPGQAVGVIVLVGVAVCVAAGAPACLLWMSGAVVALWLIGRFAGSGSARGQAAAPKQPPRIAQRVPRHQPLRQAGRGRSLSSYQNHCWRCGGPVISGANAPCASCGWLICSCGACRSPDQGGCSFRTEGTGRTIWSSSPRGRRTLHHRR
jgi:hypothetical protein